MSSLNLFFLLIVLMLVNASPLTLRAGCIANSYDEVQTAISDCTTVIIKEITVPAGKTLKLNLKTGTALTFQGNITFAKNNWVGPLVSITGSSVTVAGATGYFLDGLGAQYWDGKGAGGSIKPKFIQIQTTGGSILKNINVLNCPQQCVSINIAKNTTLINWNIDVSAGDSAGGHNTDGFDVSSSNNITVRDSVIKNQDDCVAVNQGSNYIFKNLTCSGGHGLSLSVGQSSEDGTANTVSNVTFSNCTITKSRNAIHIKTHPNAGTGQISNVTYKNIVFSKITRCGINVQQDYVNGTSTGKPKDNIPITRLYMSSITGSMSDDSGNQAVYILCGTNGCGSWNWTGISITNAKVENSCNFTPTGFHC